MYPEIPLTGPRKIDFGDIAFSHGSRDHDRTLLLTDYSGFNFFTSVTFWPQTFIRVERIGSDGHHTQHLVIRLNAVITKPHLYSLNECRFFFLCDESHRDQYLVGSYNQDNENPLLAHFSGHFSRYKQLRESPWRFIYKRDVPYARAVSGFNLPSNCYPDNINLAETTIRLLQIAAGQVVLTETELRTEPMLFVPWRPPDTASATV